MNAPGTAKAGDPLFSHDAKTEKFHRIEVLGGRGGARNRW
jgi:hypothetical protein